MRSESGIIETTDYEYDGLKRLTEEAVTTGNSTDTYAYEYDDYGNRSKMTATGSEEYTTVYDYNDANGNYTALLQEETKTVEDDSNAATENGLASSPLDLVNAASEDTGVETTAYTYDANGNQIKKVTDEKTETNTYDGLNQLIGFTDGETVASYTYDVDGLRLSKTVDGVTTKHVWDGSQQIIADVVDGQFYEADCYLRGTNLVATYSYENGAKSDYTYYTQNAHGDVVNLTDADGAITKSYTYDAFGVEKNINDADTNAFRYCGEYYDAETGTIYLRARYYNPTTGRFISRDSFLGRSSEPLGLNLYTYCKNNPIIFVDSSGHDSYIYYLPEWEDEAEKDAKTLTNRYNTPTHLIPVNGYEDIENAWELMGIEEGESVDIDTVMFNFHANPDWLGTKDTPYLVASDIKSNLELKTMKNMILLGCNAGHLDSKDTNLASQFAQVTNGAPVLASDGTVYGRCLGGLYLSLKDSHFKKYCVSSRNNTGWNIYRADMYSGITGDICGPSQLVKYCDDKLMSVNEMLNELSASNFYSSKSEGKTDYLSRWKK